MSDIASGAVRIRWISVGAFLAWLFLFGTTYAYLSPLQHAWGLNLLRYQPDWIAWLVTGAGLLVTTEEARRGLIRGGRWLATRLRSLPAPARDALLLVGAFALLWALRDRVLAADTKLQLQILSNPGRAAYPETGATLLLEGVVGLGRSLGPSALALPRAIVCAAGAVAVACIVRGARLAAPEGRASAIIPLLALSGGVGAILTGRIEAQAFVLAAAGAYLWLGLRWLAEPGAVVAPALALGVLVWLEPSSLLLLPSLALLLRPAGGRAVAIGLGLALLPLAVHLLFLLAVQPRELPATSVMLRGLGSLRGWVRPPGGAPGLGTDYRLLDGAHLKYLLNAGFVLAGGSVALAGALLTKARRVRRTALPPQRFLAAVTAGLVAVSLLVRPIWGPWDWELFAPAGLAICFWTGAALARAPDRDRRLQLAVAVAGLQLCFVGLPLVALGWGPRVDAGPLVEKRFDPGLYLTDREPRRRIAPWL